ncbi:MAG: hypothetical protein VST67_00630, partial [Nitrospirota bacterium]|nr:hypothetical protein [Nitrospirota bacterium]
IVLFDPYMTSLLYFRLMAREPPHLFLELFACFLLIAVQSNGGHPVYGHLVPSVPPKINENKGANPRLEMPFHESVTPRYYTTHWIKQITYHPSDGQPLLSPYQGKLMRWQRSN